MPAVLTWAVWVLAVALDYLPKPRALVIDRPLYFSVHPAALTTEAGVYNVVDDDLPPVSV
jgi:hypothetical protein